MTDAVLERKELKESGMRLKDKVTVITGGTRGIGKGMAKFFAQEGAKVIITGRSATNDTDKQINEELNPSLEDKDPVKYFACDVSNFESVDKFIADVLSEYGKIDVLINNAGITKDNLYMRMKSEEWDQVMDINLNSLFHICKPVVKAMAKARVGSIINMSSVVGVHGNPGQINYSTSKAGMIGFTKSLAKEYGRRGITVNCIAPGFIATEMTDELPEETQNKYKENIPLGDFGRAEDIAELALFLATGGKYVTGQVIQVDGGLFM